MGGKTFRHGRSIFPLAALALILTPCATALAQPAWYTPGVGGFNPGVPKFYQHQDFMGGIAAGANGWEQGSKFGTVGGWCGWVAYDDIFYALSNQGYDGLFQGATNPTAANWYSATYGSATNDLYFVTANNNSGNTASSLSLVFTGTGGSVNNVGVPPPNYNGYIPAGTTSTLNGPVGGANGFSLNYTPNLPKEDGKGAGFTGTFFTAIPGIQFSSGQWTNGAANVAVDTKRDEVTFAEGATNAAVTSSDIYNLVQNLNFTDVQTYLNNNVNTNANNNGRAPLSSATWSVDKNNNVDYLGLQNGSIVKFTMPNISPVTFTKGVMAICDGQEIVRITPGTSSAAENPNGQSRWWTNYHMLAVSGINVAGNQLYLADPDTNPSNGGGGNGVGPTNAGWPSDNPAFPANAPFNLKTPANANLPVPAAPQVGNANAATWNQLYTDFSFAPNGAFDAVTSSQSPQYNNTALQNLQTIMKNPFKTIGGVVAGAGKEETTIAVSLPTDAAHAVDQILVEPSQQTLDPVTNASLDSFTEAGSVWTDAEAVADPFGNALADDGVIYDLTSGNGLQPGNSATIDIGTTTEFATEGYDVLVHYEADAENPNGFWMPYMENGTQLDSSAAIDDFQQEVPEPASIGLVAVALIGMAARRRRRATH
jgi:hypothetical protein